MCAQFIVKYRLVTLHFLRACHTKNICGSAFVLVKKLLKTRDVNFQSDMIQMFDASSTISFVTDAGSVTWTNWTPILNLLFPVPAKFNINSYYFSRTKVDYRESVVENYSTFNDWISFNVFKPGRNPDKIYQAMVAASVPEKYNLSILPMTNVKATGKKLVSNIRLNKYLIVIKKTTKSINNSFSSGSD